METSYSPKSASKAYVKPLFFLPILGLLLLFYTPILISIFYGFFTSSGSFSLEFIQEALFSPVNRRIIQFTLNQAFLSTFLTIIVGLPGAYIFARYSFKGKAYLKTLFTIPFVLPPIVVVLGFIMLLGPEGLLNSVFMTVFSISDPPITLYKTYEGIILVHAFYNIPIVLRLVSSAWSNIDVDTEEVATTLGSRGLHFFRNISFPQISTALLVSAILTFLYSFTSFAIVLALGGIQFRTIEVQIYSLYFYRFDYNQAAALALVQLFITSLLIIIYLTLSEKSFQRDKQESLSRVFKRRIFRITGVCFLLLFLILAQVHPLIIGVLAMIGILFWKYGQSGPNLVGEVRKRSQIPLQILYSSHKVRLLSIIVYIVSLAFFLLMPIILIFIYALDNQQVGGLSLEGFFDLIGLKFTSTGIQWIVEPLPALGARTTVLNLIINSVLIAFLAVLISSILGILTVYITRRSTFFGTHRSLALFISWSLLLPLIISSITMALGLLRIFTFIDLSGEMGWIPLVLAHIIAAFPFVSRTISTSYDKIGLDNLEIGQTLGASRWFSFRHIELPLLIPGIIAGSIFALAISFGEFGATYLMARSEFSTMTVGIYKFLEAKQLQNSAIMASILILICITAFLLIQRTGNEEFYL